ncbi:thioredoxin-like protein [Hyaloraphidium curvatum]|nr:thioredoxin-like protein [Hyaloraphidium curvatum]
MNPDEDTEWNDVLRAKGIIPQKEVEVTEDQINDMIDEIVKEKTGQRDLDDLDVDELDELLEDDMDDQRILEEYRRKRMAELNAMLSKEKFGSVYPISKPDFVKEVTEASKECWVVVHLFQDSVLESRLLGRHLEELAKRYKATKFCQIRADAAIENYPDRNVPTLLIYGEGDMRTQLVTLAKLNGQKTSAKDVERYLERAGAITIAEERKRELEDEDERDGSRRTAKIIR